MSCRLIADCRLTASSPPTETRAKPYETWVFTQKFSRQLPSQFILLPTEIKPITSTVYFSRQVGNTPPSYGGQAWPPSQSAALANPITPSAKK
ncbi:MAG: hypothetical protein JNL76_07360 [Alphaproteobacteria bacterium]|jgi:hypothetical protein|nr:hypothetical protein [Alphaproteobacteria bacterium]